MSFTDLKYLKCEKLNPNKIQSKILIRLICNIQLISLFVISLLNLLTLLCQQFIDVVRQAVDDAEEKVKVAEKEVGSKSIKKILHNVPVPKFLKVLSLFLNFYIAININFPSQR